MRPPGLAPRALSMLLLVLAGCGSDYGIQPKSEVNEPPDTGSLVVPLTDTAMLDLLSWCGSSELPDEVAYDESCAHEVHTGPIDAVVEWELRTWSNYGEYSQVVMAPVVAQLTDDDADGDIDRDDMPDIVVVTDDEGEHNHKKGILRIIPGDGSSPGSAVMRVDLEDSQIYPYRYSNLAIGDIDKDGEPEIVGIVQVVGGSFGGDGGGDEGAEDTAPPSDDGGGGGGGDEGGDDGDVPVFPEPPGPSYMSSICYAAAFNVQGGLDWVAMEPGLRCGGHAPALADLEGDGTVEVVIGNNVYNGADGSILWVGEEGEGAFATHAEVGWHSVPVDLDLDGRQEVLTGRTIYAADGSILCRTGTEAEDGFAAAADLDLDGQGEVISVGDGRIKVFEADCSPVASWSLSGGGNGGPPTVADFDVDGRPEIGVADATSYAVYEPDGTLLWSAPVEDGSSHVTGSVVFDFEGDGRPEVIYADETRLWIFDGMTGTVRLSDDEHASRTLHEFPTVADVDGDGQTEIIVPNGGGHDGENLNGLYILGGADGGWASSRQLWNQHAYFITNINDDLSIPSHPASNWPTWNNFRSGDVSPLSQGSSPDAVPGAEICIEECWDDRIVAWVKLGNSGASGLRYDVPVSFYAEDGDGTRAWLTTVWTPDVVGPGEASTELRVDLDASEVEGQSLVVVVDDFAGQGYIEECSEHNNELRIDEISCQ